VVVTMNREADGAAPGWPPAEADAGTAQPVALAEPHGRAHRLWAADLPDDHPSYPDPSNVWPGGWTPHAVLVAPSGPRRTARSAARPAASGQEAVDAARDALDRLERLGQLTGTVAHDVNNLLTVIRNYAGFVAEALETTAAGEHVASGGAAGSGDGGAGDAPRDWEAVRRDLAQLQRAADRASELTAQLLAESRRRPPGTGAIDVNAVVSETLEMLRRPLGPRVDVRVELDDALWRVRADPARLERAIVNLAMNARDAMRRGGTLTVMTGNVMLAGRPDRGTAAGTPGIGYGPGQPADARVPVPSGTADGRWRFGARAGLSPALATGRVGPISAGAAGPGGGSDAPGVTGRSGGTEPARAAAPAQRYVCVWVSDTGDGMCPVTRARAFEPGFTTKPTGHGTGLGLSVVRDVLTEAGGDVRIDSTVGVGTTVSLLLPAAEPPSLTTVRPAEG